MSDIDPSKGSINVQLANAITTVAVANDRLTVMRDRVATARSEETDAINKVNEAQKHFDALVSLIKQSAPHSTDWRRPIGAKTDF